MAPPPYIVCRLTGQVFVDPVFASDGHTYERAAMEAHLAQAAAAGVAAISPATGEALQASVLFISYNARAMVDKYRERQQERLAQMQTQTQTQTQTQR